ncbi:MAG: anthranilate synthase component II [Candidatus Dormibacteria bacterium]
MTRKILVIDNYDSFTYNLVQYLAELGADPEVVRNDAISVDEVRAADPDGIVISPGPCTPSEAGISVELVRALGASTPILGVCLGHQAIGEAYGAEVVRAPRVMHGKLSPVEHDNLGVFAGLPSPLLATRYHSLVVDPATLPPELVATAWTQDTSGGRVLMGVRHRSHPVEGVQFHPESILTEGGHTLLRNFLDGCRARQPLPA